MGFLFTSPKREQATIIFDIGSGSVGGAFTIVPLDGAGAPSIIKTTRNDIKFRENFNFNFFMQDMIVSLDKTANFLLNKNLGAPDKIVCSMSSPWYISENRNVLIKNNKSFVFDKKIASDLIKKEISNLIDEYKSRYKDLDSIPEVVESYISTISLDGKIEENPLGKKCRSVEISMIISLSPKICLDKIREVISKNFHTKNISFSSFTIDTYLAVRDKYIRPNSYLLIDVSGEITDIGIVKDGILRFIWSFPFGKNNFYKILCSNLKIEKRDAEEIFKLYNDGNISESYKKKVAPIFKLIEDKWGELFSNGLNTITRTHNLPSLVFLTADDDIKKWFSRILKQQEKFKNLGINHSGGIITLDGPEFLNLCDVQGSKYDPFLMIEAIATMRKNK